MTVTANRGNMRRRHQGIRPGRYLAETKKFRREATSGLAGENLPPVQAKARAPIAPHLTAFFEQRLPMLRTLRACGVSARLLNIVLICELVSLALVAGLIGLVCGYLIAAQLLPDVAASLRGLYGAQIPGELTLKPEWWIAGLIISVAGALLFQRAANHSLWEGVLCIVAAISVATPSLVPRSMVQKFHQVALSRERMRAGNNLKADCSRNPSARLSLLTSPSRFLKSEFVARSCSFSRFNFWFSRSNSSSLFRPPRTPPSSCCTEAPVLRTGEMNWNRAPCNWRFAC